jgi:hypothetical protein
MTRKYTDTLIAELTTTLPDNSTGLITPALLRQVITDAIQSLRPAWAGIRADKVAVPVNFNTTATWTKINAVGFWTIGGQSDNAEFAYDLATGELVAKYADYNHLIECAINFAGATNVEYQFSLAQNGVPVGTLAPVDGNGTGRILEASDRALIISNAVNDRFSLMVRSPGGASTIQISQADLFGSLQTTRYP